jgi:hypothetical protein
MRTWYEYNNKLYRIDEDSTGDMCLELDIAGIWYKEIIRGCSGIMPYGSYCHPISSTMKEQIKTNNIIWTEEKIQSRLRYSMRDGGRHYDSIRERIANFKSKLHRKYISWLNIK